MNNTLTIESLPRNYHCIVDVIGLDNALKLADSMGGKYLYIPNMLKQKHQSKTTNDILISDFPRAFRPIVNLIGIENSLKLSWMMPSYTFYIPNLALSKAALKNGRIAAEYNGFNISELAEKHFLTPQRIRQILIQQDALNATQTGKTTNV